MPAKEPIVQGSRAQLTVAGMDLRHAGPTTADDSWRTELIVNLEDLTDLYLQLKNTHASQQLSYRAYWCPDLATARDSEAETPSIFEDYKVEAIAETTLAAETVATILDTFAAGTHRGEGALVLQLKAAAASSFETRGKAK